MTSACVGLDQLISNSCSIATHVKLTNHIVLSYLLGQPGRGCSHRRIRPRWWSSPSPRSRCSGWDLPLRDETPHHLSVLIRQRWRLLSREGGKLKRGKYLLVLENIWNGGGDECNTKSVRCSPKMLDHRFTSTPHSELSLTKCTPQWVHFHLHCIYRRVIELQENLTAPNS